MAIEILRRRPPGDHIVTDQAVSLIRGFEGLHLNAYPDPASPLARTGKGSGDPWTIGYGHTKEVKRGDRCTLDQANTWLKEDAAAAADIVRNSITVPLTAGEFAALTSMAFNFGYLPPSLRACLNGGVTDKGVTMAPGSYGEALLQFPRNCRAKAKPMKGLYRRRLAEACAFLDLPWEDACSVTVIKFDLDENGEIDTDATTTLEDTLMRARQGGPPLAPNTSDTLKKPWPELVKAAPGGSLSPDKAELPEGAAPSPAPPVVSAPIPAPPAPPPVAVAPEPPPVVAESELPHIIIESEPEAAQSLPEPLAKPDAAPVPPKPKPEPEPETKHPAQSTTIWGVVIMAMAPQMEQIGNQLLQSSVVGGAIGKILMTLGVIFVVMGRVSATKALSTSAPIRNPK